MFKSQENNTLFPPFFVPVCSICERFYFVQNFVNVANFVIIAKSICNTSTRYSNVYRIGTICNINISLYYRDIPLTLLLHSKKLFTLTLDRVKCNLWNSNT